MESICSFDPVWSRDEAVAVPRHTIKALRERIVAYLLDQAVLADTESPSIDSESCITASAYSYTDEITSQTSSRRASRQLDTCSNIRLWIPTRY